MQKKTYEKLTNTIYDLIINNQVLKFQDFNRFKPSNMITGNAYKGFNNIVLSSAIMTNEYKSPFFATYKQIASLGGQVIKGEKSIPLHFYSFKDEEDENKVASKRFICNFFNVFNLDQTTLKSDQVIVEPISKDSDFERVKNLPELKSTALGSAFYSVSEDYIHMPPVDYFETDNHWKEVFLHELTHWTGHSSRLSRLDMKETSSFGTSEYSKEELIAELGSFFLCMELGIEKDLESGSSYIQGWIKNLGNNRDELLEACKKASKACEFILERG